MTFKNILLHVSAENVDPVRGPTAWALGAAKAFGAELTALAFELDVITPRSPFGKQIVADHVATVEARNRRCAERADMLRTAARERGIAAEVITERTYAYGVPEVVADHARMHDLVVSGVDQTGVLGERGIAEHLLFESGRPVAVVPQAFADGFRCERIVVAWDGGRCAARAVGDAMPLLRRGKEVSFVTISDDKAVDSSLSAEALRAALARRGIAARLDTAKRGDKAIGEAISGFAREREADLLVMGAYGHSRLREFILGGATRGVLDAPALPTLLSH